MDPLALVADVRDLLLPTACVGCARPGAWWCPTCDAAAPLFPLHTAAGDLTVFATAGYDRLGHVVLAYKQRRVTALRPVLVRRLVHSLLSAGLSGDETVVPVPTTVRARLRRGSDPVGELAVAAAQAVGLPAAQLLRWQRGHRSQKGLARGARWRNAQRGPAVRPGVEPAGGRVVVVDDVITTGATLAAAAATLTDAGFEVVAGAVVCATTDWRPR